jgi:hypothetical protein
VTAAATMITKPSTLKNGLIEIPAMRRPKPAKNQRQPVPHGADELAASWFHATR